jgi:hypothetical protein
VPAAGTAAGGELRFEQRDVAFVPALLKIFDEILVNAGGAVELGLPILPPFDPRAR